MDQKVSENSFFGTENESKLTEEDGISLSRQLLDESSELISQAMLHDDAQQFEEAITNYKKASDLLSTSLKLETNEDIKTMIELNLQHVATMQTHNKKMH